MSGLPQWLSFWPPIMNAQILLSVRDTTIYVVFRSFSENPNYKKLYKIWNSSPIQSSYLYSEALSGYSLELQIFSQKMTAQVVVVFEIWRFLWFFFKKISENSNLFFFLQIWNFQFFFWGLSEYSQGLRMLLPNRTAQILVAFQVWRFFVISKIFQKNQMYFFFNVEINSQELWILPSNRVAQFSVVFKMWLFVFFQKKFQKVLILSSKFEIP